MWRIARMAAWMLVLAASDARAGATNDVLGPFNAEFPAAGDGLAKTLPGLDREAALPANEAWTVMGWICPSEVAAGKTIVAGIGDPALGGRFLTFSRTTIGLWTGKDEAVASASIQPDQWRYIAAVSDGATVKLYLDGVLVGQGAPTMVATLARASLAPRGVIGRAPYAGRLAGFEMLGRAMGAAELAAAARDRPRPDLIAFDTGSPHWPVQIHGMAGQLAPQDAWTLPKSSAAPDKPIARPAYDGPALSPDGDDGWSLRRWTLAAAPTVAARGEALSAETFDDSGWYAATVPGTVLTTLIDRGVYPDPDFGLNNLAIPEGLSHQDYWYRTRFETPAGRAGRHALLTFNGINYAAEVWLNGARLGTIRGAFIRGRFDVTGRLKPSGENVLAVRISPPPHPGIAQEESIAAGPGENGGMEALDGPTFIASEGWDWIPSVRDRNTGLWRDVRLSFSGDIQLDDPQVVTTLPRADNSLAEVEIVAPVENLTPQPRVATITARFADVNVAQTLTLPPGRTVVEFKPAAFPGLSVAHPALWWPNGYGPPTLQDLTLTSETGGRVSDSRRLRFGLRQITYELSLIDPTGHLRRVEVNFARARQLGETVLDVSHEGVRKTPGGWVETLTDQGAVSPAVSPAVDGGPAPFLVLKVNGVRIAARGGNWGTDDWRKRMGRSELEPYFRLHREAGLNIIRNWVGQNTEDDFYDQADEYGLLVLNDFWASTQDYQLEPQDVPLFLANAADVIARYRNHPSIAAWFGRNEGVPQPILNEGLARLTRELDGTRWYTGSSNRIELQDSGPYNYRPPAGYFTDYAGGFAVEVGSPSFPTLEAFEAAVAPADRWPISDVWAYHDWHQAGNGAVASFMAAMTGVLGAPTSLEDFERKAQLMNYETYRAMFEGMNAGLWTRNSGRLLWMTQPAWPSTAWQIYSHDYDTHAAYYGTKAAAEPVHAQMNLATYQLDIIDNRQEPIIGARLRARVMALDGRALSDTAWPMNAAAAVATHGPTLDLQGALEQEGAVIVRLDLSGARGEALSRNLYWLVASDADGRRLTEMAPQPVSATAESRLDGGERVETVRLTNRGRSPVLETKMTLTDGRGRRLLPAYYSDNYVSLLPGETRSVQIRHPAGAADGPVWVALRGWNVQPTKVQATRELGAGAGPVDPRTSK